MRQTCVCAECGDEAYTYPYNLGYMRAVRPELDEAFSVLAQKADDLGRRGDAVPRDAPDQMRDAFLHQLAAREPDKYALNFSEANALDDFFFGVGRNQLWRQAYDFPHEGQVLPGGARAVNVGMFTFTLTS